MLQGVKDRIENSIGHQLMMVTAPLEVISLGGARFLLTFTVLDALMVGDQYAHWNTTHAERCALLCEELNCTIEDFGPLRFSGNSYYMVIFRSDSDKIAFIFSRLSALQEQNSKFSTFVVKNKS